MKKLFATILLLLFVVRLFAEMPVQRPARQVGFVENKGQFRDQHGNPNPDVLYMADFGGMKVQLRRDGFSYEVYQVKPRWVDPATIPYKIMTITDRGDTSISWPGKAEAEKELMYHYQRVDVRFDGSNPLAGITPELPEVSTDRWLIGKPDPKMVIPGRFGQVRYTDVYPGVDMICYAKAETGGFKYDFVLQPGVDPSLISLQYTGADQMALTGSGDLEIVTRFGNLTEIIPQCFQEDNGGRRVAVKGIHYQLTEDRVKFEGVVMGKEKMVIDPAVNLVWGTYYGDSGMETISASVVDQTGFVYCGGTTSSTMNIATLGTFLDSLIFPSDGFFVKITPQGQRSWGTYLSGMTARDIAIGSNSDILITGENGIIKFDTTGNLIWVLTENHFQTAVVVTRAGEIVAIGDSILKLSPAGIILWKSSFGGPETCLNDVTADTSGNIIITGLTKDTTGVSTQGSYQPVYGGGSDKWGGYHTGYFTDSYGDAFLAKLSPDGNVIWSTYYGGNDYDEGTSVSINDYGKIVMAGRTNSLSGLSDSGSFQPNLSPNGPIAFIFVAINFPWSCPDPDSMWMFLDTCLYGPYVPRPFDLRYQDHDCYISWFDKDGNRISSTYYGDLYRDFSPKVACNLDKVYFGSTGFRRYNTSIKLASDFPFLDHTGPGINNDYIFLACFDTICHRDWGTYYGDIQDISSLTPVHDGNLSLSEICKAPGNNIIITGGCQNFEGISTLGTYKPLKSIDPNHPYHPLLGWDAFISKFSSTDVFIQPQPNLTTCLDDSVTITCFDPMELDSTMNYQWFKDSIPIPGGTSAILLIDPVCNSDQGYYYCDIFAGDFYYSLPKFKITVADTIEFNIQQSGLNNEYPRFGDFNRDGYFDVMGTNIYLNQNGVYVAGEYTFSQSPDQLTDIDGNGYIDILSGNTIFLNLVDTLQPIEVPGTATSWVDIDYDGDLDGVFYGSDAYSGKVFALINEDLSFTPKTYNIINAPWGPFSCTSGSIPADFNHDSETDLLVYGSGNSGCSSSNYCFYLERQADQFIFHNIGTQDIIRHFTVDAGDWDSDGFTDLLFSGYDNSTPENFLLKILVYNSGEFLTVFTDTVPGSTFNYSGCPGKWIDMDNDGDLDIVYGKDYILNNNGTFQTFNSTGDPFINTGLTEAASDAGDVNNDGYPEIISNSAFFTEISCNLPNIPPSIPEGLATLISGDTAIFFWQPAVDPQPLTQMLTYNLRVGTSPLGNQKVASCSDSSGRRMLAEPGNVYQNTSWWLHSLPPGTYYWSVQAIDNSYAGGPFAPEQTFTIAPPVPVNNAVGGDTINDGEILCFDATNTITVGGDEGAFRVNPGANVTLVAGQKIRLLPETSVSENGYLHGYITGNNEYCFTINQPIVASKKANAAAESPGLQGKDVGKWSVAVYPNPVSEVLNVRIDSDLPDEPVKLVMYNLLGTSVQKKTTSFTSEIQLPVSSLPAGIYLLSVVQGNHREIVKVLK